jgi:hypothetical protein
MFRPLNIHKYPQQHGTVAEERVGCPEVAMELFDPPARPPRKNLFGSGKPMCTGGYGSRR